ncbi:alkaline phosphatase family protein [Azospirillum doebereinerae]|uniref:alkaline phosphatase family protein n=1 Tax=Azospirillum doebereinerae TaxID=92933 RepID=UPI001EE5B9D3|nr:alkaline phosphatase family protein [Azospirillum doebereinerae]MCG5241133.1 alkaline phosphatase family protein [Azospirillum doebereinerae]
MARRRAEPSILLGPILYFRGEQRDRWWLSALFVLDGEVEPDDLRVDGVTLPVPPRHLTVWRHRHVWRFDFAVPRGVQDTDVSYGFPDGPSWSMVVPGRFSRPRLAFVCGGGTIGPTMESADGTALGGLWPELLARHATERHHLLLHGGGQIDGNAVAAASPQFAAWRGQSERSRASQSFSPAMAEELMSAGFDRTLHQWSRPAVAQALASVPSVMLWDDADLLARWGNLPDAEVLSKVMRGIGMTARRNLSLFQLGAVAESPPDCAWDPARLTVTQGFPMGETGLLALDTRTERTRSRMLSERIWAMLPDWLDRFQDCRHLILMTGTPLLFPAGGGMGRLTSWLPGMAGQARRMADQWRSPGHRAEWERLMELLTGFSRRTGCRITALSGGGGLGGRMVLRGGGVELWQLLGPTLAAPPPTRWVAEAMERLAARGESPLPGHSLDTPPFPENGRRTIGKRGWLSLAFDGKGQLHARWTAEGDETRYAQAI